MFITLSPDSMLLRRGRSLLKSQYVFRDLPALNALLLQLRQNMSVTINDDDDDPLLPLLSPSISVDILSTLGKDEGHHEGMFLRMSC